VEGIHKLIDEKYEIKKARVKSLVSAIAELKGLVNDEQWTTLKSIWKKK